MVCKKPKYSQRSQDTKFQDHIKNLADSFFKSIKKSTGINALSTQHRTTDPRLHDLYLHKQTFKLNYLNSSLLHEWVHYIQNQLFINLIICFFLTIILL